MQEIRDAYLAKAEAAVQSSLTSLRPHQEKITDLKDQVNQSKMKNKHSQNHRPGNSSWNMLKGQGHFHFAKETSIVKSSSQWETFEGAQNVIPDLKPQTETKLNPVHTC